MPNQPRTRNRVVRVSDELWEAAQGVAKDNDETISEVIRRALAAYAGKTDVPFVYGRRDREPTPGSTGS